MSGREKVLWLVVATVLSYAVHALLVWGEWQEWGAYLVPLLLWAKWSLVILFPQGRP